MKMGALISFSTRFILPELFFYCNEQNKKKIHTHAGQIDRTTKSHKKAHEKSYFTITRDMTAEPSKFAHRNGSARVCVQLAGKLIERFWTIFSIKISAIAICLYIFFPSYYTHLYDIFIIRLVFNSFCVVFVLVSFNRSFWHQFEFTFNKRTC